MSLKRLSAITSLHQKVITDAIVCLKEIAFEFDLNFGLARRHLKQAVIGLEIEEQTQAD